MNEKEDEPKQSLEERIDNQARTIHQLTQELANTSTKLQAALGQAYEKQCRIEQLLKAIKHLTKAI